MSQVRKQGVTFPEPLLTTACMADHEHELSRVLRIVHLGSSIPIPVFTGLVRDTGTPIHLELVPICHCGAGNHLCHSNQISLTI
jgi:hypothetical protein